MLKQSEEGAEISHFMKRTEERIREKILLKWLAGQLQVGSFMNCLRTHSRSVDVVGE
jgi:hypothetical protein